MRCVGSSETTSDQSALPCSGQSISCLIPALPQVHEANQDKTGQLSGRTLVPGLPYPSPNDNDSYRRSPRGRISW
nr:hypothetical protein CFP56_56014 [Quercus suber]